VVLWTPTPCGATNAHGSCRRWGSTFPDVGRCRSASLSGGQAPVAWRSRGAVVLRFRRLGADPRRADGRAGPSSSQGWWLKDITAATGGRLRFLVVFITHNPHHRTTWSATTSCCSTAGKAEGSTAPTTRSTGTSDPADGRRRRTRTKQLSHELRGGQAHLRHAQLRRGLSLNINCRP